MKYEIIADYPNSRFYIGQIIELINDKYEWYEDYSSVRCSIGGIINKGQYKTYNGHTSDYTSSKYEFEQDCSKHTIKRNFDLNNHMIWLVKRNLEPVQESTIFA